MGPYLDSTLSAQWGTSCLNILGKAFAPSNIYYKNFKDKYNGISDYYAAEYALGILKAAVEDYKSGLWRETKILIEADVFDDFLEQAEALQVAGYFQPAAVVAGAVLEDGLRKLCDRNGIAISDRPKLDKMNADLAKHGAYTKLVQKNITFLADLRNKAAHGQWDELTPDLVQDMLHQVRRFMADYLT